MKTVIFGCLLFGLVLLSGQASAVDCDDVKNPDDNDFKNFFKTFSCKVKQGAEEVADATKPITDKIGEGAKSIGSSVAQKYEEIKHRLTDDPSTPRTPAAIPHDAPTERVPLAPIAPSLPADLLSNPQSIPGKA